MKNNIQQDYKGGPTGQRTENPAVNHAGRIVGREHSLPTDTGIIKPAGYSDFSSGLYNPASTIQQDYKGGPTDRWLRRIVGREYSLPTDTGIIKPAGYSDFSSGLYSPASTIQQDYKGGPTGRWTENPAVNHAVNPAGIIVGREYSLPTDTGIIKPAGYSDFSSK